MILSKFQGMTAPIIKISDESICNFPNPEPLQIGQETELPSLFLSTMSRWEASESAAFFRNLELCDGAEGKFRFIGTVISRKNPASYGI